MRWAGSSTFDEIIPEGLVHNQATEAVTNDYQPWIAIVIALRLPDLPYLCEELKDGPLCNSLSSFLSGPKAGIFDPGNGNAEARPSGVNPGNIAVSWLRSL